MKAEKLTLKHLPNQQRATLTLAYKQNNGKVKPFVTTAKQGNIEKKVEIKPVVTEKESYTFEDILKVYEQLNKKYPKVIDNKVKNIKILARKIHKDIQKDLLIPAKLAKRFCAWYCSYKQYKIRIQQDRPRYNLLGEVTGYVTTEEERAAKEYIAKKRMKSQEQQSLQ